jgi:phosphoglycolate phosphatase
VLADSAGPISACINTALVACGFRAREPESLHRYIGPPLAHAFAELTGEPASGDVVKGCVAAYRDVYPSVSIRDTRVFAGVPEMLGAVGSRHPLGVATSKPRAYAEPLIEALGLRTFFAVIAAPGLSLLGESKTQTVGAALAALGADWGAMVGDRNVDMAAAVAHGLLAVGALWGMGSVAELREAGADVLVDAPAGLLEVLVL